MADPLTWFVLGVILACVAALVANLGIGGGVVFVPILLLLLPWEEARLLSLLLILTTAGGASLRHVQAGKVTGKAVAVMLPAALAGVIAGLVLDRLIPTLLLQAAFLGILAYVIWRWLGGLGLRKVPMVKARRWGRGRTWIMTILGGAIATLLGIGGGIIFVPILLLGVGLRDRAAVGTSSTVIVGVVGFSVIGHVLARPGMLWMAAGSMGLVLLALMAVVGIGSWVGSSVGIRFVPDRYIRSLFLVVLVSAFLRMAWQLVM